ncbi:TetR/AcrR family transcriptional regulator [Fusibacter paucivorans]|uniref:TetR/AcrR family transcriptional regulator n=1 Tax=Fusibacter paucivorans TaxID=76009 RepID=A0ABS5PP23_9FIRM|nr:TetR/AcrR family transcriptional regulator [Fusibacter paucivorans]MBS7526336.1 TetR/AcrR family transcriptional regulator [Fusibacter paucivorans]
MNKTKSNILMAAIEVVSKKGYHPATMDEIAKEANVAKGTLYYYFESKESIFNDMIDSGISMIREEILEKIKVTEDSMQQLRIITRAILTLVFERRNLFKIIISQLWGEDIRQIELRKKMNEVMDFIEAYIINCVEDGYFEAANTRLKAFNYFGAMMTTAVYYLNLEEPIDHASETMIEEILSQL